MNTNYGLTQPATLSCKSVSFFFKFFITTCSSSSWLKNAKNNQSKESNGAQHIKWCQYMKQKARVNKECWHLWFSCSLTGVLGFIKPLFSGSVDSQWRPGTYCSKKMQRKYSQSRVGSLQVHTLTHTLLVSQKWPLFFREYIFNHRHLLLLSDTSYVTISSAVCLTLQPMLLTFFNWASSL